ncbi:MAG: hypothetical protein IKU65_06280 [Oscillospiraceae bacterium]|nr:hypothetical protein [Oscillospiraceae bacterium]
MFDETNNTQEQDLTLPDKLFDDDEVLEEDSKEQNESSESVDTLRIKYNGEERDITLDEARVLAQKGMNYDHVVSERDTKYQRELQFLDRVAAENGMTREQYMRNYGSEKKENTQTYENVTASPAERARAQLRRITDAAGLTGPWSELFKKYPSLSRESAYSDLSENVRQGMTPLEAYQERLLAQKERELLIAQNNNAARLRSVGSLEGDGAAILHDDFLEGFAMTD